MAATLDFPTTNFYFLVRFEAFQEKHKKFLFKFTLASVWFSCSISFLHAIIKLQGNYLSNMLTLTA